VAPLHGPNEPGPEGVSSLHWKLDGSLALSPKFADVLVVREPAEGPPVRDVVGAVVSMVQVRETVLPTFPYRSTPRTLKV
jgi:hypothetical protein